MTQKKPALSMNAKLFAKVFFDGSYLEGTRIAHPKERGFTDHAFDGFGELIAKGFIQWNQQKGYVRIRRDIPQTVSWKAIRNRDMLANYKVYPEPSLLDMPATPGPEKPATNDHVLRQEILNTLSRMAVVQAGLFHILDQGTVKPDMFKRMNETVRILNGLGAPKVLEDALKDIEPEA